MQIRLAQAKDIIAIQDITYQTALLGSSASAFWDDVSLFFDLAYLAYLIPPIEFALIAEDQGAVQGYVLCASDKNKYLMNLCFRVLPFRIVPRLLNGQYHLSLKTLRFISKCIADHLDSFFMKPVSGKLYPAVLHINVKPGCQGKGFGSALLKQALHLLKAKGISGVHLHTTSYNTKACALYLKYGFKELTRKKTLLWEQWIKEKVYKITYIKKLQDI